MNRQIYRVVFSHVRNAWTVVAECARTRGKQKGLRRVFIFRIACNRVIMLLAGVFPVTLFADIVADPAAPLQQPIVINAANGTPLVNIRTPDSRGLSHNRYQQFDVLQNGVILNNSRSNVQTRLGGWVQGNPNLTTGVAHTILNEVNSSKPSLLNGFIEVAGTPARVIVANPSGLTCNGCGFINAWRATLTTGMPVLSGGDLSGYRVTGGVIRFLGQGLDTSAIDYTDVISRAVVANAGVWARQLDVVLGTQQVNVASNGEIISLVPVAASSVTTSQVALDVAALGGMYAGKIHLIGTEHGLGVNNAGVIGAAGELSLDINGQLTNTNKLIAQGDLLMRSDRFDNQGQVLSGANIHMDIGNLDNRQQITAAQSFILTADQISNSNAVLAAGQDFTLDANYLSGDGKIVAGGDLNVDLDQDYAQSSGLMQADGNLSLHTQGTISNASHIAAGNTLEIAASDLDNQVAGEITGADTGLNITHTLSNRGLVDGGNTFIQAATFSNQGSGQIFGDHVAIRATQLNNQADTTNGVTRAATIAARKRLDIGVSDALINQSQSLIFSLGNLSIGGELDSLHQATGQGGNLTNTNASIEAGGDLRLNLASIHNLNAGISTKTVTIGSEDFDQFTPRGQSGLYNSADYPQWQIGNENISWRYGATYSLPFNFREYWRYIYSGTTTETRLSNSQPAEIIAGRNLGLTGNVINSDSRIIAGAALIQDGGTLVNLNSSGNITTNYSGSAYYYDYDGSGAGFDYDISRYGYNPAPLVTTTTLPTTQYLANTTAGHDVQIVSLSSNSLGGDKPVQNALNTLISLYSQTSPTASYLIETNPRFANYGQWLSSDYMLNALSYDPAYQTKRLGDGFYEQRLVREQINQLTGKRFLAGYSDDQLQYQALMTNGVTFAQSHQLVPGVALSEAQVAQLTSDIVWLVTQTVTLPDGSTTQALVPQVYTRLNQGDLGNAGSLISGQTLHINLNTAQSGQNTLINSGTLAGQNVLSIQADNIQNLSGQITGKTVSLNAKQDITNRGGSISAQSALLLNAGHDIQLESTTFSSSNSDHPDTLGYSQRSGIDRLAGLYVTDSANAMLVAMAGNDIQLNAAHIANSSEGGVTALSAGHDIDLNTQTTALSNSVGVAKNYIKRSTTEEAGTQINTAGDIQLQAGNKLGMRAGNVTSEQGQISAQASEIDITAGKATLDSDQYRKTRKSGFMSSSKTERRDTEHDEEAIASTLSANNINLRAGDEQTPGNLTITGSDLVASQSLNLNASGSIDVSAAQETHQETHDYKKSRTGFSASSTSVGYGSSKLKQNTTMAQTMQRSSTIGSVEGDVTIAADQAYTQTASDVLAPKGDIDISAQKVDITAADNTAKQVSETRYKQSGISLSISNPVINAIQTANQMKQATSNTSDGRMQALAAGATALVAINAYDAVQGAQGVSMTNNAIADAANQAGGINLSISIGSSKNSNKTTQTSSAAQGSQVIAGGDVNISASGAGENSDINVIGSSIKAGNKASLKAEDEVNLIAAQNSETLNSKNKNSSASLGVSIGSNGFAMTAGASQGKGKANGTDVTWTESVVEAGNKVTLESGTDTNLIGSQVKGNQVVADVGTSGGGNLNIQSLQDTSTYDSKQKSAGISVSVPIGAGSYGGSISVSNTKIDSDYASVNEQSGIYAGDGGFQVNVNGNTDLKGAVIASSEQAIQSNSNSLTTDTLTVSNIENKAEYEGKGVSATVGGGIQAGLPQLSGAGMGSDSENAGSTTVSAISQGLVSITDNGAQESLTSKDNVTTVALLNRDVHVDESDNAVDSQGNSTANTIAPIFDAEKIAKEIQAQMQITEAFGQQANKAVGDYVQNKRKALNERLNSVETTEGEKTSIQTQLKELRMEEQVMNVLIGAVTGFGGTTLTKEALSVAADQMRQLMIEDSRKFAGVVDKDGKPLFSNLSGDSDGVNGSGQKIAGTRADLDLLCGADNGRCEFKYKPDGSIDTSKPVILTEGYAAFLKTEEGQKMLSAPFGGLQGGERTWLFGLPYEKGGWVDKLLEAFAGPHDLIGGEVSGLYDEQGNIKRGMSETDIKVYDAWSGVALVPAAPFAAAQVLPTEIWQAISVFLKAGQ